MTPNEYDVGDRPRLSCSTKDENGVPTDPTDLTIKYLVAGGTVVTKTYGIDSEVVKDSTGEFHMDLTLTSDMNGKLVKYRWTATGAVIGADENEFRVRRSAFF